MGIATHVCRMMTGMFFTAIDGYDGLKVSLSIAGTVKDDVGSLVFGPKMEGLQISADFTNAPCLATYGGAVYMFYPDGSALNYVTYSGTGWSTSPLTVLDAQPAAGASAVAFNNLLYVFYQGPSQGLWYNVFNGATWTGPMQVPLPPGTENPLLAASQGTCSPTITFDIPLTNIPIGAQYASAPSAVVFDTQLYVLYQSSNGQQLRCSVFNGSSWIEDYQVADATVSCSPSAVVYNGQIYVIYQGREKNGCLYYNTFAGSAWSSGTQIPSIAGVSSSPQACVFNDNIVVVHQGNDDSTTVYYLSFDGSDWSNEMQLLPISLSYAPAPVVFNSELLVFMQDKNKEGDLYYTISDGSTWSPMNQVVGASITNQPAPVVFNGQLYVFYAGPDNAKIYYSRCTTSWSWSSSKALNTISISSGPSAIWFEEKLVCLFQDQTQLFCTIYDAGSNTWAPPAPLPINVMGTVSAVTFAPSGSASQMYIFYQAAGESGEVGGLWFITLVPSTTNPGTFTYSSPTQIKDTSLLGNPSAVVLNSELCVFYQSAGTCYQASSLDGTTWTTASTGIAIKESPSAVVLDGAPYLFYQGATNDDLYVAYPSSSKEAWTGISLGYTLSCSPSAAVFNDEIYVFFQGVGESGWLYSLTYSSSGAVSSTTTLLTAGMSGSPAAAVANGQLHLFYEGPGYNEQLQHSYMDSSGNWSGGALVQSAVPLSDPAMISYKNVLYCVYESYGQLCYSINAGGTSFWTTQQLVPNATPAGPPSVAIFNGVMYIFYGDASSGELLYVTYSTSTSSWTSPAAVANTSITSNEAPSAVVFDNELYVFYPSGTSGSAAINYCTFNGSTWTVAAPMSGTMANSPSAVVFETEGSASQLYLFFSEANGWLYYTQFDGSQWSTAAPVAHDPVITGSPSAAATPNSLYVAYQASDNSGELYYSTFCNGSWSAPTRVSGAEQMAGSPALAALNNYSVWAVCANANGQLFCNELSGVNSWETQIQLIPENLNSGTNLLSNAPSAAIYDGQIYVAYKAHGHNNIWYNASSDGNTWGPQTAASGGLDGSPSLVTYNNQLYLFHTGDSNDGKLGCTVMSSDGKWCNDTQIYIPPSTDGFAVATAPGIGPSAVVFGDQIFCFINSGDSQLGYVVIDSSMIFGTSTHPCTSVIPIIPPDSDGKDVQSSAPGAVAYNGNLYAFVNSPSLSLDYFRCSNPGYMTPSGIPYPSWTAPQQAGVGPATSNGGGGVAGVLLELPAAIAEPFISEYLLPCNLANTAFIRQTPSGPKWVKPTWTLTTDVLEV